jgi:hypothetical protein
MKAHRKLRMVAVVLGVVTGVYALGFLIYRSSGCWVDVGDQRPLLITGKVGVQRALYWMFYPALRLDETLTKRQYVSLDVHR